MMLQCHKRTVFWPERTENSGQEDKEMRDDEEKRWADREKRRERRREAKKQKVEEKEREQRRREEQKRREEEGKKREKENGWKREQKAGATNVAKSATIESNVGMCLLQGKGLNKTLTEIFTVNANCLLINSKTRNKTSLLYK